MELLLLAATYVLDVVRYYLGGKLIFDIELARKWPFLVLGAVFFAIGIGIDYPPDIIYPAIYISNCVMYGFCIDDKWWARCYKAVSIFLIYACLDEMNGNFVIVLYQSDHLAKERLGLLEITTTIALTIICLGIRKFNTKRIEQIINKIMPLVLFVGVFAMGLGLKAIIYFQEFVTDDVIKQKLEFVSAAALICLFVLLMFVVYIKNNNDKMKQLIETERQLKEMQEKYYLLLLAREEDTRGYRHDMNNHFICLKELAEQEQAMKTFDYIDSLQDELLIIQKRGYSTGNGIFDILFNTMVADLKNVKISVKGKCIQEIDINEKDMCIIFSNIIKNAVEEVKRQECEEKYIVVEVIPGNNYVRFNVKNSSSLNERKEKSFRITSKQDKKNHGFGISNIEEAVLRNEGTIDFDNGEKEFAVSVTLRVLKR